MGIKDSHERYLGAVQGFKALRQFVEILSGPTGPIKEQILPPTEALLKARSELVRDVAAEIVRRVMEAEELKFMASDAEQRKATIAFLADHPEMYIRTLKDRLMKEVQTLEVSNKLQKIISDIMKD